MKIHLSVGKGLKGSKTALTHFDAIPSSEVIEKENTKNNIE